MSECKRCGRETRDEAYGCDDCGDELARTLGEMPWLTEQLDISITRQHSSGLGSGGASHSPDLLGDLADILDQGTIGHMGTPWHETASRAKRALHATLSTWVRFCDAERVRHQAQNDNWPADNMPSMSRWLMWRVDGLMLHELGCDAIDAITHDAAEARRIVLWKPKQRFYLAACEKPIEDTKCPGDVYADEGADYGTCEECSALHEVSKRRLDLNKRLDDHLCTAADIARMAVFLGLQAQRATVRNKVNVWHKRGRITPKTHAANGDPMFRYGEVRGMLAAAFERDRETVS